MLRPETYCFSIACLYVILLCSLAPPLAPPPLFTHRKPDHTTWTWLSRREAAYINLAVCWEEGEDIEAWLRAYFPQTGYVHDWCQLLSLLDLHMFRLCTYISFVQVICVWLGPVALSIYCLSHVIPFLGFSLFIGTVGRWVPILFDSFSPVCFTLVRELE